MSIENGSNTGNRGGALGISWPRAFERGADWRYLALFVIGVLVPSSLLLMPVASFLQAMFDHSPRAGELLKAFDSAAFTEVMRQVNEPIGNAIGPGLRASLFIAALFAPALAGATVAVARKGQSGGFRPLLVAMGELYPRMIRLAVTSLVPLGIAGGVIAAMVHFAEKSSAQAVLESSETHVTIATSVIGVVLVWLANVTVEAGRAYFAAEPDRTSALSAWWSGVKLTLRHPGAVLGLSLMTTLVGVGIAAIVTALRLRVPQGGTGSIAFTFLLAQLAVAALAWGRASRLVGIADLIRAESEA